MPELPDHRIFSEMNSVYEKFRKRIVEEDNIINHRMMWATLAQTGLFAAYGVANLQTVDNLRMVISIAIASAGAFVAYLNLASVSAAHAEIAELKSRYERIMTSYRKKSVDLPVHDEYWISVAGHGDAHSLGHKLDTVLPKVVIALWGILTLWVLYKGLVPPIRTT